MCTCTYAIILVVRNVLIEILHCLHLLLLCSVESFLIDNSTDQLILTCIFGFFLNGSRLIYSLIVVHFSKLY